MPLVDLERDNKALVTILPHQSTMDMIRARLTQAEFDGIISFIDSKIDGKRITNSSFLPGSDWTGTALYCLWDKAARKNEELAAKMFGLLVYYFFAFVHPDLWYSGYYPIRDREDLGRTYFQLNQEDM
jgi:hypothetical protein